MIEVKQQINFTISVKVEDRPFSFVVIATSETEAKEKIINDLLKIIEQLK